MSFGSNLRETRERCGYTQVQTANIIGIDQSAVAKYESDVRTPNILVAARLATLFDTTCESLVGNAEMANIKESIAREKKANERIDKNQ